MQFSQLVKVQMLSTYQKRSASQERKLPALVSARDFMIIMTDYLKGAIPRTSRPESDTQLTRQKKLRGTVVG